MSAIARNERTLGRAARWDGVLLGAMTAEGGMDVVPAEAVADVAARGATWVLITGWLDELRDLAAAPPPGSSVGKRV